MSNIAVKTENLIVTVAIPNQYSRSFVCSSGATIQEVYECMYASLSVEEDGVDRALLHAMQELTISDFFPVSVPAYPDRFKIGPPGQAVEIYGKPATRSYFEKAEVQAAKKAA